MIIENYGRLDNMLRLCLTTENVDEIIDEEQLSSLQQLVLNPIDTQASTSIGFQNNNVEMGQLQDHDQSGFMLTSSDFWHHKTSLSIDSSNNFYFKLLPPKIAAFLYYDIVLNKYYSGTLVSLYAIIFVCNRFTS